MTERTEWLRNMAIAFNGGHMMAVGFDGEGPGGRDWYFDCECSPENSGEETYRATRDEALLDLTVHMFEHGLTDSAIEGIAPVDAREAYEWPYGPLGEE